jgi:hypothetical protein
MFVRLLVVWYLIAVSLVTLFHLVFWLFISMIIVYGPFASLVFVVRLFVLVVIDVLRFLGSFVVVISFFVLLIIFFVFIIV